MRQSKRAANAPPTSERDIRILIARALADAARPLGLVEIMRAARLHERLVHDMLLAMLHAKEVAPRDVGLRSPKWVITDRGRTLVDLRLDREGGRGGFDDAALAAVMARLPVRQGVAA